MDTIKKSKASTIDLSAITMNGKRDLYLQFFSSKTNTNQSFADKIELLTLLGFLTQELCKRKADTFKNSYDVLTKYIYPSGQLGEFGDEEYIQGVSIVCDDLIWGVNPIPKPEKYSTSTELRDRIKELISQWLPF